MLTQDNLNTLMVERGVDRYRINHERQLAEGRGSNTKAGKALMGAALEPFVEAIRGWLKGVHRTYKGGAHHGAEPYLKLLEPPTLAYLTLKTLLDCITTQKPYSTTTMRVGKAIEDEARMRYLKGNAPDLFKSLSGQVTWKTDAAKQRVLDETLKEWLDEHGWEPWGISTKAKVGLILLHLLTESTGLVETVNVGRGKATEKFWAPTEAFWEWIKRYNTHHELLSPVWMPTVEPPRPWEHPVGGGYDPEVLPPLCLVKRAKKKYVRETLSKAHMPEVYEAVNALQATPWRINPKVLSVFKTLVSSGSKLAGLPGAPELEFPTKPEGFGDDPEVTKRWKREAAKVYQAKSSLVSHTIQMQQILAAAELLKDSVFYFPHNLDFRGRVYSLPSFLSPQGCDQSKGLLTFARGQAIVDPEAEKWLAISGANRWGFDKVPYEQRVGWVSDNEERIQSVAGDPLGDLWWTEADEPWQFLAWCFEWSAYRKQGRGYVSSLPVSLDGTNNGLQILSLLTRDEESGRATNCTAQDHPEDIYGDVADCVTSLLKDALESTETYTIGKGEKTHSYPLATLARYWLTIGIDRKTTKRPVMTMPYGSTFHSCRAYVRAWCDEQWEGSISAPETPHERMVLSAFLAGYVWQAIEVCINKPKEAMGWLQEAARVFNEQELPVEWTTPVGFPVLQRYQKVQGLQIKTALGSVQLSVRVRQELPQIDNSRQKNGIAPNFVHSLDAAALVKTVCLARRFGIEDFAMVHDSYGTLAANVEVLAGCTRRAYGDIFSLDQLKILKGQLQGQLPVDTKLPELPLYGSLDPEELNASEFFFS